MSTAPLAGKMVAISISNAPDMAKLGYPPREVGRALFSICGALVRAGARIGYGGNLDPSGYTFKIFRFLAKAYAMRQEVPPFVHYLPETVLREAEFGSLVEMLDEGSGIVDMRLVQVDGKVGSPTTLIRTEEGFLLRNPGTREPLVLAGENAFASWRTEKRWPAPEVALTAMRELVSEECDARIIMGGKMGILGNAADRYAGRMPGVVEETLATLQRSKPVVVLGAFGGAARDIAIKLGLLSDGDRVARGEQIGSYRDAIVMVAGLRERIPSALRPKLCELAALDRTEALGYEIVNLLREWEALQSVVRRGQATG